MAASVAPTNQDGWTAAESVLVVWIIEDMRKMMSNEK